MACCTHCQFANSSTAQRCARCGSALITLVAPLPEPMVEPILTPQTVPDSQPLSERLALTVSVEGKSSVLVLPDAMRIPESDDQFAPITIIDPPGESDTFRGRTLPAHPGLPGLPMNDSVYPVPQTIPATDRAVEVPAREPAAPLRPRLIVLRGMRISAEYPVYEGRNSIGRFADKPVDIDLVSQESIEQIWCSRQHAVVVFDRGMVRVEDLNSLNGTWVNGIRVPPGQPQELKAGDVLQVGTVQMKLVFV